MRVLRGDRVGIVGPNGAGKTTLINLLTGELEPDSGTTRLGASLELATLDQRRAALREDMTLKDTLTGGGGDWVEINGEKKHVIGYMRDFLFMPEQARTPVSRLSGGERARLLLARALSLPSNLLVLDEPTNDLDLETLDLLEEMIADYPGTVIVVSHDRDFLDRVATSVIVAEGGGVWREYAGGYSDMVAQRGFGVSGAPAEAKAAAKPKGGLAPTAPREDARKKMTFKQKHALEKIPEKIEALKAIQTKLQAVLNDSGLYARDKAAFEKASKQFAETEAGIARLEDEWLELETLREQLGA